jgi:hypothetical protein
VVQEGRGGYGAHTVKNWCARRARGTQGRDRSEGRAKWWTRRKTKKQKKPVEKKKKIFGPSTLHENRPPSPTKKTLRVYLRTTCTSGKGLYGHKRSICVLYRNIVSTRVCANNFFSVVQNGIAVVYWHYRAREGKVLLHFHVKVLIISGLNTLVTLPLFVDVQENFACYAVHTNFYSTFIYSTYLFVMDAFTP